MTVGMINAFAQSAYGQSTAMLRLFRHLSANNISVFLNTRFADCDLLHSHSPFYLSLYALRRYADTPHIFTLHTDPAAFPGIPLPVPGVSQLSWEYVLSVLPQYDYITVPTSYLAQRLRVADIGPVSVIPSGVDTHSVYYDPTARERFIAQFGLSDFILTVGRLDDPRKNIRSIVALARQLPAHTFVVIGDIRAGYPPSYWYKHTLMQQAPDNVYWLGYQPFDIVRGAYAAAYCVVHPSYAETEGLTVLEAMACETPVIVRPLPAYHDFLAHGSNALFANSLTEFHTAISQLTSDTPLYRRLAHAGRQTAEQRDSRRVAQQHIALYDQLLNISDTTI